MEGEPDEEMRFHLEQEANKHRASGLADALASSALLSGFLYGIDVRDPWSYLAAVVLLLGIGLFACIAPAYRASRVDPATTLQGQ